MKKLYQNVLRWSLIGVILLFCNLRTFSQWQQSSFPSSNTVFALATNGTSIFAGTGGDGVLISNDNGTSWTTINSGLTNDFIMALATNGTSIFAGTAGDGVFLSTNNGASWSQAGLLGQNVHCLYINNSQIFAGTSEGGVSVSINNGSSWTSINTGLPTHSISAFAVSGSNIFASTWDSGVFLSTNNGTSWTSASPGLPDVVFSLAVKGTSIFAGTEGNGVYLSNNNGAIWTAVNNGLTTLAVIQAMVVLGSNIYAGNYSWGVFLSTNNGENWTDVSDGLQMGGFSCYSLLKSGIYLLEGTGSAGIWKRPLSEITDIQTIQDNNTGIRSIYSIGESLGFEYNAQSREANYVIFSPIGQIIQAGHLSNTTIHRININNIMNGVYLLSIRDGGKLITKKFVFAK